MYINYINDRKYLGFNCLRDRKALEQVTAIFVTGIICIGIYLNSSLFLNGQEYSNEKISNQESNILKDYLNSGVTIETGNGKIIILVKDDGILPGVDGFSSAKYPRKPHSIPRVNRRRGINVDLPQIMQGLGDIQTTPKIRSFAKVETNLNAQRGNRSDQCSVPELDMKKEYENFTQEILEKGYELDCSQERFNELSTNPQTNAIDEKSLIEAKGALQGEVEGMYTNIRRPTNKAVDLDFEIDSSKGYTHVDFKTPIDFEDLADKKGIDVSNFPSLETVAYNMGKKIPRQKKRVLWSFWGS